MIFNQNQIYKIYVNDNLYFELAYDVEKEEPIIKSFGNTPDIVIEIKRMDKIFIVVVAGIPQVTINLNDNTFKSRLNVVPTAAVRNYIEDIKTCLEDEDFESNRKYYDGSKIDNPRKLATELHTHFMEVLNGEDFLNVVLPYIEAVGFDENGNLIKTFPTSSVDPRYLDEDAVFVWKYSNKILKDKALLEKLAMELSLPVDKQVSFLEINRVLTKRTALVDLAGYNIARNDILALDYNTRNLVGQISKKRADAKVEVYVEILKKCLEVLKKDGIKYVEFSYSNPGTIKKIMEALNYYEHPDIKFSFLLSENRNRKGSDFCENYVVNKTNYEFEKKRNKASVECNLKKLLKLRYVKGFDLMGAETEILPKDNEKDSIGADSLYDKLAAVLRVLNSFNDDEIVCRLHAGEMVEAKDLSSNPEKTLEIIDQIAHYENLLIPPPSIRIGHGLHINQNERYLELLKKFKVTVEINASSNFALGNIKNMKDIPYKWYVRNNIPVVLGTDGGGFYLTTGMDESYIAQLFGGKTVLNKVIQTEEKELKKRGM